MYEAFYGLRERPFDLTPNPRYLFMTAAHREALTTIQYGLTGRKGMTVLLGPAGTGKTSLVHAALENHAANVRVLYLANPILAREEFFEFFALECGLSEAAARSKTHALAELREFLLARRANGGLTALIIDEAQAMPRAIQEEVRLLTNIETSTEQLMSIVLVGQVELAERLNEPGMLQFKQRVALRSKLEPLNLEDTIACITERIRIAGGDVATIFTRGALADIFDASRGIPRTISVICDNALVSGFAVDERPIDRRLIAEVCADFDFPAPRQDAAPQAPGRPPAPAQQPAVHAPQSPQGSSILKLSGAPATPASTSYVGSSILNLSNPPSPPSAPASAQEKAVPDPPNKAPAPPRRGFLSLFMGVSR